MKIKRIKIKRESKKYRKKKGRKKMSNAKTFRNRREGKTRVKLRVRAKHG